MKRDRGGESRREKERAEFILYPENVPTERHKTFGLLWPTSSLPLYLYLNALSENCYHRHKDLLVYNTQLCPSPFSLMRHLKAFPQTHRHEEREGESRRKRERTEFILCPEYVPTDRHKTFVIHYADFYSYLFS
jgi:hypothetical protein